MRNSSASTTASGAVALYASVCVDGVILSNFIANQTVHEKYGGVVPELASRDHIKRVIPLTREVLKNAQIEVTEYLAGSFQLAKDRGWVKPDTDLMALSYWIQGVFIGHIMLDITEQTEHEDAWSQVAYQALQPFLAAD